MHALYACGKLLIETAFNKIKTKYKKRISMAKTFLNRASSAINNFTDGLSVGMKKDYLYEINSFENE